MVFGGHGLARGAPFRLFLLDIIRFDDQIRHVNRLGSEEHTVLAFL